MKNNTLERHLNYSLIENLIASDSIISSSQLSSVGKAASRLLQGKNKAYRKWHLLAIFFVSAKPLKDGFYLIYKAPEAKMKG